MGMKIGKEKPRLQAKPVTVIGFEKDTVTAKGEMKEDKQRIILNCLHPDGVTVRIGSVKYERNGRMDKGALWLTLDEDGNISSASALAHFLRYYGVVELENIEGKTISTVTDNESGFLIVKAY